MPGDVTESYQDAPLGFATRPGSDAGLSDALPVTGRVDLVDRTCMLGRRLLLLALLPYVLWLVFAYEYHLVDGVNLAAHEAGHMFFRFFGQTMHVLGGSVGQLVFPVAFTVYFLRRGQRFDAAVMVIWIGESLMYLARYLGDAEAQRLPLVGGHIHDWNWLLTRAGLLAHCETIAFAVHVLASVIVVGAFAAAAYEVRFGQRSEPAHGDDELLRVFP